MKIASSEPTAGEVSTPRAFLGRRQDPQADLSTVARNLSDRLSPAVHAEFPAICDSLAKRRVRQAPRCAAQRAAASARRRPRTSNLNWNRAARLLWRPSPLLLQTTTRRQRAYGHSTVGATSNFRS